MIKTSRYKEVLKVVDFNCFVGDWPFYKLRKKTFADLKRLHEENGIDYGYVSSLQSIFYNDFYESEKDLFDEIKGSLYKQVVTVNPELDGAALTLKRCIDEFDVKGIRIVPGYHKYNINSEKLKPILDIAREFKLPLFITLRIIDERLMYLYTPEEVSVDNLEKFINDNADIPMVICNIKNHESAKLEPCLTKNPRAFLDISGYKGIVFSINNMETICKKTVFGSFFPMSPLKSALMVVDNELEDEVLRNMIKSGEKFLEILND